MKRILTIIAAGVVVVLLAGCIDYSQTIKINDDLSGTAEYDISMSVYLGQNMLEDGSMPDKPENFLVQDFIEVPNSKITGKDYDYNPETEMERMGIQLKLNNLNDLNGHSFYADHQEISVTEEDGKIVYREIIKFQSDGYTKEAHDSGSNEYADALTDAMQGYMFTFRVEMPGKVIETDEFGKISEDGKTVEWSWKTSDFIEIAKVELYAICEN